MNVCMYVCRSMVGNKPSTCGEQISDQYASLYPQAYFGGALPVKFNLGILKGAKGIG